MTPINVVRVVCPDAAMSHIRVTCRCGHSWVETIPTELHNSHELGCIFECTCGQKYMLRDKQLRRLTPRKRNTHHDSFDTSKEDVTRDRRQYDKDDPFKYDA